MRGSTEAMERAVNGWKERKTLRETTVRVKKTPEPRGAPGVNTGLAHVSLESREEERAGLKRT